MRRETTSVSQEDYLKAIWELVQEEQAPISARLAEDLGVTPPAVTAALKRMTRGGYLRVRRDGHIELSAKGQEIAGHLVLRHRLAEKLLTDVIGLEWARAHEEAERLEHGISPGVAGGAFGAVWAREPLPAWCSARRRDGETAAEIWRRALVRRGSGKDIRDSARV